MIIRTSNSRVRALRSGTLVAAILGLTACAEGQMPAFLQGAGGGSGDEIVSRGAGGAEVTTVERDIEAPEIFQATEAGLWDGRPSLGGVWVAHPDVTEPERVLIRNENNGQFVIGALFKRERQSPGPRLQVSSDAAAAIAMLAGAPTNLNVVALRREEIESAPDPVAQPAQEQAADALVPAPAAPEVTEGTLDPVVANAAAALDEVMLGAAAPIAPAVEPIEPVQMAAVAPPKPAPAPKPAASSLRKAYIQIGIFSMEQNAQNTATAMRQDGMVPTVKKHQSNGKTFWRVVVGPAQSKSELNTLITKIKGSGFSDAYAVDG